MKILCPKILVYLIWVMAHFEANLTQKGNESIHSKDETEELQLIEIATRNGIKVYGGFVDGLSLPLLIYKGVFSKGPRKKDVKSLLSSNKWSANGWSWSSGASPTPHYHDNCHETLVVLRGHANIKWGINGSIAATANAGDVIFQPSGCYHAGDGCSQNCVTMGVYPDGSPDWYFAYDGPNKQQKKSIDKVSTPNDPVFGENALLELTTILQQKCKV